MIKKAGEKNIFIVEEAEKAISEMVEKGNTVKIVQSAMTLITSKIISIKVKVIFTMNLVLEWEKDNFSKFKEINNIVKTLGKGI